MKSASKKTGVPEDLRVGLGLQKKLTQKYMSMQTNTRISFSSACGKIGYAKKKRFTLEERNRVNIARVFADDDKRN